MSTTPGGWFSQQLGDFAGELFGGDYLRDYTHASKIFRTNGYQNTPKYKYLFHTYFQVNPEPFLLFKGGRQFTNVNDLTNFGLLVKDVKLPSYTVATQTLNQYNRKRIIQSKINYDPIDISFHDDNGDTVNALWEAYYSYYYNDTNKLRTQMLPGNAGAAVNGALTDYNRRNIYEGDLTNDLDWGYNSTAYNDNVNNPISKTPFFKRITVFGFNQHNFTAYTFVNPIIKSFSHDSYAYNETSGIMQNKMTIEYETVVYNYGAMDGRTPGNIVTGFGDVASYDRNPSPLGKLGTNGNILGQGGLLDAAGGVIDNLRNGNIIGAGIIAGSIVNTVRNTNLVTSLQQQVQTGLMDALNNTPNRNNPFLFPTLGTTPSNLNTAGAPATGSQQSPTPTSTTGLVPAGQQNYGAAQANSYPPPIPIMLT
jgi:hypothetical protein